MTLMELILCKAHELAFFNKCLNQTFHGPRFEKCCLQDSHSSLNFIEN